MGTFLGKFFYKFGQLFIQTSGRSALIINSTMILFVSLFVR